MAVIGDGEAGVNVRAKLNATGIRKNNFAATAAPTVNDDSSDGYEVGSLWLNLSAGKLYICIGATEGAAAWLDIGGTSGAPSISASDSLAGRVLTISVDSVGGTPSPTVTLATLTLDGVDVSGDAVETDPGREWTYTVPSSTSSKSVVWGLEATNTEGTATTGGSETIPADQVAPTVTASDSLSGRVLTISVDSLTGTPTPTVSLSTLTLDGVDVSGDATGSGPWNYNVPGSLTSQTVAWEVTASNASGSATSSGSEVVPENQTRPVVTALSFNDATGELSFTVDKAGNAHVLIDAQPVDTYDDCDDLVAAAPGMAYATAAVTPGPNSFTLDTSSVTAGTRTIHVGVIDGDSVPSLVDETTAEFTAAAGAYTHTPRFNGSTALTQGAGVLSGATIGSTGLAMGVLAYYDGVNWTGRLFSCSQSDESTEFWHVNQNNATFQNRGSTVSTSAISDPASPDWYMTTARVQDSGGTTTLTYQRDDAAAVTGTGTTSGTGGALTGWDTIDIGRVVKSSGNLNSPTGKVCSAWVGQGDPAGLIAWWAADKTRDPLDYDDSADPNFTFLAGWDVAGDGTAFADLTLTDRFGSMNSWAAVGTPTNDTPAPPFA